MRLLVCIPLKGGIKVYVLVRVCVDEGTFLMISDQCGHIYDCAKFWKFMYLCCVHTLQWCSGCVEYLCGCVRDASGAGRWWSPQSGARSRSGLCHWPCRAEGWCGRRKASTCCRLLRWLNSLMDAGSSGNQRVNPSSSVRISLWLFRRLTGCLPKTKNNN